MQKGILMYPISSGVISSDNIGKGLFSESSTDAVIGLK
jgi:hypothetical protein